MHETVASIEDILRPITEATATASGDDFLRAMMSSAAVALGMQYAFIVELDSAFPTGARIVDYWNGEKFLGPRDYDMAGSPCEDVLIRGEVRYYPEGVADLFPLDVPLRQKGIESYLAVPLIDTQGKVIGHFALLDSHARQTEPLALNILNIFGMRAGVEMERRRLKDALTASHARLSSVMTSAMDAIVTINSTRRIELFNPAAERIFACSAAWAIGQPFDRFLTKAFRNLLATYLREADKSRLENNPVWISEPMTAVRASREEFPIEATISAVQGGPQPLYTIVLRDVNEQWRAKAEIDRLQQRNALLREEMLRQAGVEDAIGQSPAMLEVLDSIATVAPADATVLVCGETGTGKEMVAHAIHNLSPRRERLLVKMNCAALPSELIESELFGHEKGAFTGAINDRRGRFEMADGGTLFLDEVGELTLSAQSKLLRVLQEREFERVGGTRSIRVDVRVVAATNRDLGEMVKAGTFRSDLFYRLNVFPVTLPPLRERTTDIPLLVEHFLRKFSRKLGRRIQGLDEASMQRLQRYDWPGNVRELQNVIERAVVLCAGPEIVIRDRLEQTGLPRAADSFRACTLEEMEAAHIGKVLRNADWKIEGKRGAAAILGLEPSTLRYRMQKLGIRRPAATAVDPNGNV